MAARAQRLAHDLLADALGVGVGGVDQVHARVAGHADLPLRRVHVELADGLRPTPAAVAHGAQRDRRDEQARPSQLPILHAYDLSCPHGSVPPAPCSTPTRSSRPHAARSARTSASTSAGTASAGRPPPSSPRDHASELREEEPGLLGIGVTPEVRRSGNARCSCARRTATCCGTASRCSTTPRGTRSPAAAASTPSASPTRTSTPPTSTWPTPSTPGCCMPRADRAVDPAPLRPARAVRRPRRPAARRDAGPHRRPLRRRRGAALGGGRGGARRAADRRHHHGRAGPRVGELHVELPEPHPARPGAPSARSSSGSPRSRSTASTAAGGAAWW